MNNTSIFFFLTESIFVVRNSIRWSCTRL